MTRIGRLPGKQNYNPGPRSGQRTARRREAAAEREQERGQRSAQEQIAALDARLGVNAGAKKERARLARLVRRAS